MSHNKITVENQAPDVQGAIDLNAANIGSFTSTSNKFLGIDANSDLVQRDAPTLSGTLNWTPVYHFFARPVTFSGSSALSVNDTIFLRVASGTIYTNSSYISVTYDGSTHSTWANRFTCQAGTYLFNFCFMGDITTSSDECIIRLKNITDNTILGNKGFWGDQHYSSNMYTHVTIDSTKSFNYIIESLSGAPWRRTPVGFQSVHLNIWRL